MKLKSLFAPARRGAGSGHCAKLTAEPEEAEEEAVLQPRTGARPHLPPTPGKVRWEGGEGAVLPPDGCLTRPVGEETRRAASLSPWPGLTLKRRWARSTALSLARPRLCAAEAFVYSERPRDRPGERREGARGIQKQAGGAAVARSPLPL